MLGNFCRSCGDYVCGRIALRLAHLEIPQWMINFSQVSFAVACGFFLLSKNLTLAIICLFLSGVFDYLDGGVARARLSLGKPLKSSGTLRHVLTDKISEIIIFSAMIAGKFAYWPLGMAAIITCLLLTVTGVWLRNKNLFELEDSLFDRADRIIALLLLCSFGFFNLVLVVISLLNVTEFTHRVFVSAGAAHSPQSNHVRRIN